MQKGDHRGIGIGQKAKIQRGRKSLQERLRATSSETAVPHLDERENQSSK